MAHLPLGKNKDNKASSYAEGTQIVRRNVSLKESSQLSFVRKEANVHPIDIWDVSSLKGKHYEGLKFRRNLEQIDGKHIGTKTFASVGINTALLLPNVVGQFIIDVANVNDVVKCDPIDGRLSCQQRERQRYGQQQQLRDTKHGTPVAREYKGASQLHLGLTEKLNFAPANVSQMSSVKDLEIEMLIQVADNWTKKEAETREKVSEEENRSRLTEVFTPLEVSDTHAATPHELTLGRKETGAESDSASETAMEGQMNAQVEMTNRVHEIETTPLDEVHDKRIEREIGIPWVMKVPCTPMPSELKNKVKDQSTKDHKYVIGSRLQRLYTEDRQEAMYNVLRQGFKEVLEVIQGAYPGDFRARGVYDMRFGQKRYLDKYQQPMHLDEGQQLEFEGQSFHSRGFISLLRPRGGPRFVDILTLDDNGKFLVKTVRVEEDEVLMMSPNVWHAGKPPTVNCTSQGDLSFGYYDGTRLRNVSAEVADESPFVLSFVSSTFKKILETNIFPAYRIEYNGQETRSYHYMSNCSTYDIPPEDELISARFIAATITCFTSMEAFTNHVNTQGLPGMDMHDNTWSWKPYVTTQKLTELPVMDGDTLSNDIADVGVEEDEFDSADGMAMQVESDNGEGIAEHVEEEEVVTVERSNYRAKPMSIIVKLRSNSGLQNQSSPGQPIEPKKESEMANQLFKSFKGIVEQILRIETDEKGASTSSIKSRTTRSDGIKRQIQELMSLGLALTLEASVSPEVQEFPLFWMTPLLRLIEECTDVKGEDTITIIKNKDTATDCVNCTINVKSKTTFTSIQQRLGFINFDRPVSVRDMAYTEYLDHVKGDKFGIYQHVYDEEESGCPPVRVHSHVPTTELMKEWAIYHIEYIQNLSGDGLVIGEANWPYIQRISQEYRLMELASHLLDKLGLHQLLKYLQRGHQQLSNIKGWIMRYCILKAIQDMAIDETNVELKVTCGTKKVDLKYSNEKACTLCIKVAIHCEEGEPRVPEGENEHTVIVDGRRGNKVHRKTSSAVQKDTQGLKNRKQTCYGICILHTFAYLTQFFPILQEHHILGQLSFMKFNGQDKVSDTLSQSMTDYIVSLMAVKAKGTNWRISQKRAQDSAEFLTYFIEDIERNSNPGCILPFSFELVCKRLYECAKDKDGCGHLQPAPTADRGDPCCFMQIVELGVMGPNDEIDISMLIERALRNREDITVSDHLKRCLDCVANNSSNPANSPFCIHKHNPCERCTKQFETQQSEQQFKIAPKLLIILISRNKTEVREGRLQHCVKVNSHVTLRTTEDRVASYQIACIICHEGRGQGDGHYVTYIRSKGHWWLYNDDTATCVQIIDETVCGRDVVMCFYVSTDLGVEIILEDTCIGTNERRPRPGVSTRTQSNAKRSRPS